MPTRRWVLGSALSSLATCSLSSLGCAALARPAATLSAYRDEAEMTQALARWRSAAQKLHGEARRKAEGSLAMQAAPMAAPAPAMAAAADKSAAAESITNVQTAGVDEGGIVKRAGDHLLILRRGRLFTVRIGADALQPSGVVNAYAPGSSPQGAWYDELLVSGSTVVVVGYSYARGGTEIGLFELGADGSLAYRATYHLRSFDYYSARNYASRLIGRRLVFYTPTYLQPWGPQPTELMPAWRRWRPDATPQDFKRILPATRVYRTDDDFDPHEPLALHTVTSCELGGPELRCESTAVLGPAGRVFYVSQGSVYVWTNTWREQRARSSVFRIPLDGAAPTAIKTAGVPLDQMSFLEDAGGHLNVLLRESGRGEAMWNNELTRGSTALLRVPLSAFGDGSGSAQREHYRSLPGRDVAQNRFVGDWLLWGGEEAWAVRYAQGGDAQRLAPGHRVERIEAMGAHAVLVGNAGNDLHFSSVRLGSTAELAGRHVQPGASQGETRTHGFFFRPTGSEEGLLGLPLLGEGRGGGRGEASVLFLRQRSLVFDALGRLEAHATSARDDACEASCVDWYGNARPLFIGDRVFALMGYELVEGRLSGSRWRERIEERRRIDFGPRGRARDGRYSPFDE